MMCDSVKHYVFFLVLYFMYAEGKRRITSLSDPQGRSLTRLRQATRSIATHPLNGMLGHRMVTPSCILLVPIYTPG